MCCQLWYDTESPPRPADKQCTSSDMFGHRVVPEQLRRESQRGAQPSVFLDQDALDISWICAAQLQSAQCAAVSARRLCCIILLHLHSLCPSSALSPSAPACSSSSAAACPAAQLPRLLSCRVPLGVPRYRQHAASPHSHQMQALQTAAAPSPAPHSLSLACLGQKLIR